MSPPRRTLSLACWLAIAGLLVRIAAGGALEQIVDAPSPTGVIVASLGLTLIGVSLLLVAALAAGSQWARPVSVWASMAAVVYGALLVLARHESGLLIALAAAVALLAALTRRTSKDASA